MLRFPFQLPITGFMPGEWEAAAGAAPNPWQTPGYGGPLASPNPVKAAAPGLLGKIESALQPYGGMMGVGANLLAQSGQPGTLGGAIGNALLSGRQSVQQGEQDKLRTDYMRAQIEAMRRPDKAATPTKIQEYEYAKAQGYQGSYLDFINQGASGGENPANVREYEYAKSQGFKGSYLDFQTALRRAGASSVNVNTGEMPKPPPGYFRPDPTKPGLTAEPGGPVAASNDAAAQAKVQAYETYRTARDGLMSGLSGAETNPIVGRLPAVTPNQQIAEGGIAAMGPVLKQLFRSAGEGVFTDKDQQLLLDMVPKRTDFPEVREAKMRNIDAIVASKLGIGVQPPGSRGFVDRMVPPGQGSAPNAGPVLRFDANGNPIK